MAYSAEFIKNINFETGNKNIEVVQNLQKVLAYTCSATNLISNNILRSNLGKYMKEKAASISLRLVLQ